MSPQVATTALNHAFIDPSHWKVKTTINPSITSRVTPKFPNNNKITISVNSNNKPPLQTTTTNHNEPPWKESSRRGPAILQTSKEKERREKSKHEALFLVLLFSFWFDPLLTHANSYFSCSLNETVKINYQTWQQSLLLRSGGEHQNPDEFVAAWF